MKPPKYCFCCGQEPGSSTIWTTHGNYGSGVFDPMDGTFLRIVTCDKCLEENMNRAQHLRQIVKTKFEKVK